MRWFSYAPRQRLSFGLAHTPFPNPALRRAAGFITGHLAGDENHCKVLLSPFAQFLRLPFSTGEACPTSWSDAY